MTQPAGSGGDGTDEPRLVEVVSVLWWRAGRVRWEMPRTYRVGWVCADGSASGVAALSTPHAWLDAAATEAALSPTLISELGPVALAPAAGHTSPVVDLGLAGHRLRHADLALTYGMEVVGGVVAELRGRGVKGTVVFERTLSTPVRAAVASWAVDALLSFRHSTESDLRDAGWQRMRHDGWQLLATQPGHQWQGEPEH